MEQTLIKPGGANENWPVVFVAWAVLVGVVYLATDFSLLVTAVGMAGVYAVYRGVRAVWQSVASRSVERKAIGSLGGHVGPVAIEGTASPADEPVTAPMTGTESVAYRVQVFQYEPETGE